MVTKIGLDLGYANIAISDASLEVDREPSIAIIDKNTRRIVSVGRDALSPENAIHFFWFAAVCAFSLVINLNVPF